MRLSAIFVSLLSSLLVKATHDWSNPCFNGQCSFGLRNPDGSNLGTLDIVGSPQAISDITPAAGWTILGCDPNAEEHDIRLVCTSAKPSDCEHLLRGDGPKGKIVRLPDSCGKGPFARVSGNWLHDDQSLPSEVETVVKKRGIADPQVHGLRLDTKLSEIDNERLGPVHFTIRSTTTVSTIHKASASPAVRRRDPFDETAASSSGTSVNDFFTLFDAFLSCKTGDGDPVSTTLSGRFNVNSVTVAVNVTVEAQGTISPPTFTSFALNAAFDSNVNSDLSLGNTAVTGDARTNFQQYFSSDLSPIQIPGILTVTPRFIISASSLSQMRLGTIFKLGIVYPGLSGHLSFPRSAGCSSVNIAPGNTGVRYSIAANFAPKATTTNNIGYHFVPRLEFGLDAFSGQTTSTIFLNLDASASTVVQLPPSTAGSSTATLDIKQGILAHAGAQGSFYGLFDDTTSFDVESKAWTLPTISKAFRLFRRRDVEEADPGPRVLSRQASAPIVCVWPPQGTLTINDDTVPAGNFNSCGTVAACLS
ncbi:hypothetical protein HGRIS_012270 [Hohenbuehelia grisea]|uniref:Uncharacterized protein n=1 Tax=Hohenbuehelia grisea TaxID=104357 RepID=A0ABR3IRR1_9AGAR